MLYILYWIYLALVRYRCFCMKIFCNHIVNSIERIVDHYKITWITQRFSLDLYVLVSRLAVGDYLLLFKSLLHKITLSIFFSFFYIFPFFQDLYFFSFYKYIFFFRKQNHFRRIKPFLSQIIIVAAMRRTPILRK